MAKLVKYVKESYAELSQKVSWPTWKELQHSAIVVSVASLIITIVVYVLDITVRTALFGMSSVDSFNGWYGFFN